MANITNYSNSTISQVEIGSVIFDITDANTRSTVATLCNEVNNLTAKTARLYGTGNTQDGTGVSISFTNSERPKDSYVLGLKPDTFSYLHRHPKEDDSDSLIWTSVFDFQKLDIEGSTLTGQSTTVSNYVIQITNSAVYKIGHLVIGSFTLRDEFCANRMNNVPYTLVKGLPKPSTDMIKLNAFDLDANAHILQNMGFIIVPDPNSANNRGLLKWSSSTSERTTNKIMVNIMYNTPS